MFISIFFYLLTYEMILSQHRRTNEKDGKRNDIKMSLLLFRSVYFFYIFSVSFAIMTRRHVNYCISPIAWQALFLFCCVLLHFIIEQRSFKHKLDNHFRTCNPQNEFFLFFFKLPLSSLTIFCCFFCGTHTHRRKKLRFTIYLKVNKIDGQVKKCVGTDHL